MRKLLPGLLFGCMLAMSQPAAAQSGTSAAVEYSEQVADSGPGRHELYKRALDWSENHFAYGPKTDVKADADMGSLQLMGTTKISFALGSGAAQERTLRFVFRFQATDNGYTYSVGTFRIIPDPKKVEESVPLDEFIAQLAADKNDAKTHNERRVTARANSQASEIALAFRSYMNSLPAATEDGSVGLNSSGEN